MIKARSISVEEYSGEGRQVIVSLVADTKEEVNAIGADGSSIVGLADGDKMSLGSTCLCATGDFGILNSQGVWTF